MRKLKKREMDCPYIIGKRIYLRPLKPKDIEKGYLKWINDPEVNEFLDACKKPVSAYNLKKYYEQVVESDHDVMFAIVVKSTDKHIGNVKLGKIDWVNRIANYGRMIGDKDAWGRGYGTEALELVMAYAFNTLNLNRIYTPVIATNLASRRSNEKAGMKKEGVARQARFIKGKYLDIINYAITRDQFLKLKRD